MMKLFYIFALVSLVMLVVACKTNKNSGDTPTTIDTTSNVQNPETANVVFLEYTKQGTMAQPDNYFKVELGENGKVKVTRQRGMAVEELTADTTLLAEILNIYNECNIQNWKNNYQPSVEILDGYMWNLEIKFDNGNYKYSHGNNAGPNSDGLSRFSNLIWELK